MKQVKFLDGGFKRGELVVIAANTSEGKSMMYPEMVGKQAVDNATIDYECPICAYLKVKHI